MSPSREWDGPVSPLCSRNARSEKTLVGRAQWGTHPGHPGDNVNKQIVKNRRIRPHMSKLLFIAIVFFAPLSCLAGGISDFDIATCSLTGKDG